MQNVTNQADERCKLASIFRKKAKQSDEGDEESQRLRVQAQEPLGETTAAADHNKWTQARVVLTSGPRIGATQLGV